MNASKPESILNLNLEPLPYPFKLKSTSSLPNPLLVPSGDESCSNSPFELHSDLARLTGKPQTILGDGLSAGSNAKPGGLSVNNREVLSGLDMDSLYTVDLPMRIVPEP